MMLLELMEKIGLLGVLGERSGVNGDGVWRICGMAWGRFE